MTTTRLQQLLINAVCGGTLALAGIALAPSVGAQTCASGFIANPYTAQCLAPVSTPVISGIPCVASNIGICSSFLQNQQPPRRPQSSVAS
ncbi:MAG: hypothetical protein WCJ53_09350 [Mycobacteriaceae bacterium]